MNAEGKRALRGGAWYQGTLAKVLRNPLYVGLLQFRKEVVGWGAHEPIVALDEWLAVQRRLDHTARSKGNGGGRKPVGGHLFRKGMLRCGRCRSSMVARSRPDSRDTYICLGAKSHGPSFCNVPPVPRAAIDGAVFEHFTRVGLDLDATRDQIRQAADARLSEVRQELVKAERERADADRRLARVRRHYQEERIEAADWAEQRPGLTEEAAAAQAKVAQLQAREAEVLAAGDAIDADSAVLARVEALRAAIAGKLESSDLDGVRAALESLFVSFTVERFDFETDSPYGLELGPEDLSDVHADGYVLTPEPRQDALQRYGGVELIGDDGEPLYRRLALPTTDAEGFTT